MDQHRQDANDAKDAKDGQRTRDPREREELERVTGEQYMDAPATGGDEAASDDAPLPDHAERRS
jgi:hypothetical protein